MRAVCGAARIKCQAHSPPCSQWGAWTGAPPQPSQLGQCGAHAASKNGLPRHLSVFRGRGTRISRLRPYQSPRKVEGRFCAPRGVPRRPLRIAGASEATGQNRGPPPSSITGHPGTKDRLCSSDSSSGAQPAALPPALVVPARPWHPKRAAGLPPGAHAAAAEPAARSLGTY